MSISLKITLGSIHNILVPGMQLPGMQLPGMQLTCNLLQRHSGMRVKQKNKTTRQFSFFSPDEGGMLKPSTVVGHPFRGILVRWRLEIAYIGTTVPYPSRYRPLTVSITGGHS